MTGVVEGTRQDARAIAQAYSSRFGTRYVFAVFAIVTFLGASRFRVRAESPSSPLQAGWGRGRLRETLRGFTTLRGSGSLVWSSFASSNVVVVGALDVGAFLPLVILLSSGRLLSIDRSAQAPDAEILRLLQGIPFFTPLPAPAMERVTKDVFPIEAAAGDLLIREGDHEDLFYVIVEGRVEITRAGELVSEQDRVGTSARSPCSATSRGPPRSSRRHRCASSRSNASRYLLAVTGHPGSHEAARVVTSARMA